MFLYPPQTMEACARNSTTLGEGVCGENGNSKIFEADQTATTCSNNPENGGKLTGPFAGIFGTTTELIGRDNALLYQVFLGDTLFQSQLTTLTTTPDGQVRRTRSAQSFFNGVPASLSFFRERKVDEATFYEAMHQTLTEYNILESDTCAWTDNFQPGGPPQLDTSLRGLDDCRRFLDESFAL